MFEKVNPQHPDKVADRIAGAIVDLAYAKAQDPKIAVEVLIGHGECTIIIETDQSIREGDVLPIVERIGGECTAMHLKVVEQDRHLNENQRGAVRCGDNGIFKGCPPTHEQKLLTAIAASIYDRHPTDGKYIIRGEGRLRDPEWSVTVCQSHMDDMETFKLLEHLHKNYGINNVNVNPLGAWAGGTSVDSGATNRKLGSDMGDGVTGGGLHGKDLSKADVSVNIWCYLQAIKKGQQVQAHCSIGDDTVNGVPYEEIVEQARLYIHTIGGFEKFAEWGLIRPKDL